MPALITHHVFGEESMQRLPHGLIASEDERVAFLIANQGPDPFFFRVRTPNAATCMKLAHRMHSSRMTRQFEALRDGVSMLNRHDAGVGRAFVLGLLSHYVLDRTAHPFVYAQQWGVQKADPTLADAGSEVHAVIESDLDVLMLQLKRSGATVAVYPPESELVTTERVNKVAGALMCFMARSVYGLDVGSSEYGGAVADMKLVYQLIEPSSMPVAPVIGDLEALLRGGRTMLGSLSHRVTTDAPRGAGNLDHRAWSNPFTDEPSRESFPEVFDRALDDYEVQARAFAENGAVTEITAHTNYSGCVLGSAEESDE